MLDGGARHVMDLVTREPSAMTEVRFLIITEKVLIEEKSADLVNNVSSEHKASAFGAEDGINPLILGTVRLVVPIMIRNAAGSEEGATDVQSIPEQGQDHLALDNADVGIFIEIIAQGLQGVGGDDRVVIEQQHVFARTKGEAEIVSTRETGVGRAGDYFDGRELAQDLQGIIRGAVFYNDDLPIWPRGHFQGIETGSEQVGPVVINDNDRKERPSVAWRGMIRVNLTGELAHVTAHSLNNEGFKSSAIKLIGLISGSHFE